MRDAVQLVGWLALVVGAVVCLGGMYADSLEVARATVGAGVVAAVAGAGLVQIAARRAS